MPIKTTPDWENKIKNLTGKEIEHTFKKDETKLDGTKATAEEKVKVNDTELLLHQIKEQKKVVESKKTNLKNKGGYTDDYVKYALAYDNLKLLIEDWKDNLTSGKNYAKKYKDFRTTYKAVGWDKLVRDYTAKKTTVAGYSSPVDYTNLYEGRLTTAGMSADSKDKEVKITEQEAIKLITATLKQIEKIDPTEFTKHITTNIPNGVTIHWKNLAGSQADNNPNATTVQGWLTTLQTQAKNLVATTDKETGRPEYSFGHGFVKNDNSGMVDTPFTKASLQAYFELLNFCYRNSFDWLSHPEVQTKVFKDMEENQTIKVIPAKDSTYANPSQGIAANGSYTEGKLHSWGQENYLNSSFANSTKATNFYGDIPKSEWKSKVIDFEVDKGISGWSSLNLMFFDVYGLTNLKGKWERLTDSFDTNIYSDFFNEYRSLLEDGFLTSFQRSGTYYTLHEFPNYFYEKQKELYRLQGLREAELKRLDSGGEELRTAQAEYEAEKAKLATQEQALEDKITAKITELRDQLKTKYKVSDSQTPNFGSGADASDANRLTLSEHYNLQTLIKHIRYLASGEEEKPTGKVNEDSAFSKSKEISSKCVSDCSGATMLWRGVAWEESNPTPTIEQKITQIKSGKDKQGEDTYKTLNLEWFHSQFEELEKLVKLDTYDQEAKTKLKAAIDNRTPTENMNDWRNSLKTIESGLETALTDDKINKWKDKKDGQAVFNNLSGLNTLLKKVCVMKTDKPTEIEKANEDFLAFIKGKDDKLTSLAALIKEKDPAEVIKYIHQWEFNKLSEDKKKARYLKFAWSELGGKQKIDSKEELGTSEKEKFEEYLYQCAIGKINESALSKPGEQQTPPPSKDENKPEEKSWYLNPKNFGFWALWGGLSLLVIGTVCLIVWWDQFKKWWDGEEEKTSDYEE